MPKKIDPEVRERALRLLQTHGGEYASLTAAAEAIAKQVGVGKETSADGRYRLRSIPGPGPG